MWSIEIGIATSCVSRRQPFGKSGRMGRSIMRAVSVPFSPARPSRLKKLPGILPAAYMRSSTSTVSGRKSTSRTLPATAVASTMVSPCCTTTAPLACLASLPVSKVISSRPTWTETRLTSVLICSFRPPPVGGISSFTSLGRVPRQGSSEPYRNRVQKPLANGYREVGMEAASVPLQTHRTGLMAVLRERRRERRVRRLLSDANRFERAAARLEAELQPDCWQVRQLRGSAEQLRELALVEAA